MFLPYLKFVAAFFANACAALFVADAGRLVTFGAYQLYLGSVQRGLNINQAAGLAHLAGLYMLGNHIDLLDDDFTLSRANGNNFAAHALGFTGQHLNGIAGFYKHLTHSLAPPLKHFRSKGQNLHVILIT